MRLNTARNTVEIAEPAGLNFFGRHLRQGWCSRAAKIDGAHLALHWWRFLLSWYDFSRLRPGLNWSLGCDLHAGLGNRGGRHGSCNAGPDRYQPMREFGRLRKSLRSRLLPLNTHTRRCQLHVSKLFLDHARCAGGERPEKNYGGRLLAEADGERPRTMPRLGQRGKHDRRVSPVHVRFSQLLQTPIGAQRT